MLGPSLSLDPLHADHHLHSTRHGHGHGGAFGVMTTTTLGASDDYPGVSPAGTRACRSWTGMPIRAVVPLPRRASRPTTMPTTSLQVGMPTVASVGRKPRKRSSIARAIQINIDCDDSDESDADADGPNGKKEKENDEAEEGGFDAFFGQSYSYESISASEGLAAWSFEELRVECYAQSLVARGSKPPLVAQPSLAIPPAFVPRIVRS